MTARRVAVVGVSAALLLVPSGAAAHPFGPPPTARVSADGRVVEIRWEAAADDTAAIGEELGVMPAGSAAAYRQEAAAQVALSRADEARLTASQELVDYLGRHIVVVQDGEPCAPTVPPMDDFVHEGTRVLLECPAPVTDVTVRITMLHDLHEAYRTFATGVRTAPAEAVFTTTAPEHTWRFGVQERPVPPAAAVGGALLACLLLGAGVWAFRRRGRA